MGSVRVGVIGLGEVAQSIHLPVLSDLRTRFAIAGAYDPSPSLMALVTGRYAGVRGFASAEALIDDPAIDAVFILSPDETHEPYLRRCIQAGKHVFLEKPPCLTLREIDGVLPLAEGYPKVIFVGYMRRYSPAFLAAKAEMPPAEEITHVRIFDLIALGWLFMRDSQDILYPEDVPEPIRKAGRAKREALWREVAGQDASDDLLFAYHLLTAMNSHHLSAMRELLGEPRRVIAACQTNRGANASFLLDYGHYVTSYQSVVDEIGLFDAMIEVRSHKKRLRIIYDTPYIRSLPTRLEITEGTPDGVRTRTLGPLYKDAFTIELEAFHRHVQDGTRPKTSLADARNDLVLWAEIIRKMKETPLG